MPVVAAAQNEEQFWPDIRPSLLESCDRAADLAAAQVRAGKRFDPYAIGNEVIALGQLYTDSDLALVAFATQLGRREGHEVLSTRETAR